MIRVVQQNDISHLSRMIKALHKEGNTDATPSEIMEEVRSALMGAAHKIMFISETDSGMGFALATITDSRALFINYAYGDSDKAKSEISGHLEKLLDLFLLDRAEWITYLSEDIAEKVAKKHGANIVGYLVRKEADHGKHIDGEGQVGAKNVFRLDR